MGQFKLVSEFTPQGDQPEAINALVNGIEGGDRLQVLLGVTGSGKTYTLANVIERIQRPALVIAHNKTLAAQLCSEFREFFPDSAVEYFVSYYDYYQPEAYIASSDTYIEKEAMINDEIDKMRHSATCALNERRDVIIVASVSCIYALGDPAEYLNLVLSLRPGMKIERNAVMRKLIDIQYQRNDIEFTRGTFHAKGDVLEIYPISWTDKAVRVEFFDDEIERIKEFDPLTGATLSALTHIGIYPASHYATSREKMAGAFEDIEADLNARVAEFTEQGKLIEAQRIEQRTRYDLEMMREIGYCQGIENYSRYFDGREPGQPPFTLLDYFPKDFVVFVDESHVTLPQLRSMYRGDRARKEALVEYGFRIPSAFDNRPLKFEESMARIKQLVCVSATPADYEIGEASQVVRQLLRPTGLVDPEVIVRPATGQVDDILSEIRLSVGKGYRVLVTTLTRRMAEDLTEYLTGMGVKVRYMHYDIETIERMEILRDLRLGEFDVLVGINLLREGLDLPEVGLVAILDADKEGFLRSTTSLLQTVGRAARNAEGRVIMYADVITDSMKRAIDETSSRREYQMNYNAVHGITPKTIRKSVRNLLEITSEDDRTKLTDDEKTAIDERVEELTAMMRQAALELEFEKAAMLRDEIAKLRGGEDKQSNKPAPGTPGSRRRSFGRKRK